MNNLQPLIALTQLPGLGSTLARQVLQHFGDADTALKAPAKQWRQVHGIGDDTAVQITKAVPAALQKADDELVFLEKNELQAIDYQHPQYPQRLNQYTDSPLVLYYKGTADLNAQRIVAIVGTRQPTERGMAFCRRLVEELQAYNVLIVSGLAKGIDITAHQQCLDLQMLNIGVVAHGLDNIYPHQHRPTAQKIIEQGGILTEFVSGVPILQKNFPMRNRIIAGMSDAVVVIETARTGGSMITAYFANEYQKDVFALPGRIEDEMSAGCNLLIKNHRASLLESADDIATALRWQRNKNAQSASKPAATRPIFVDLSEEERRVVELLQPHDKGVHLDQIIHATQISTSRMAMLLLELEIRGIVRSLPGKHYAVVG